MVSASLLQVFCFVLILTLAMAGAAYFSKRNFWQGGGGALLELGIWTSSLLACAGADYLLMLLNSNQAWGSV